MFAAKHFKTYIAIFLDFKGIVPVLILNRNGIELFQEFSGRKNLGRLFLQVFKLGVRAEEKFVKCETLDFKVRKDCCLLINGRDFAPS